jgi:hypothetical protein
MAADPDVNVRNGAELLDRLIKDVVTEGNPFDLEKFIPLLSDRVNVFNPECRKASSENNYQIRHKSYNFINFISSIVPSRLD